MLAIFKQNISPDEPSKPVKLTIYQSKLKTARLIIINNNTSIKSKFASDLLSRNQLHSHCHKVVSLYLYYTYIHGNRLDALFLGKRMYAHWPIFISVSFFLSLITHHLHC